MSSLRQLLATHAPLLVIDAASTEVQVGWLEGANSRWVASKKESGVAVFELLESARIDPAAAGAFIFCDGPGSILGVRTVAMALRTWSVISPRKAFAYHSLSLVARALADPTLEVIADARRDSWHAVVGNGELRRVPTPALGPHLAMPSGFRHWTPLPAGVREVPYRVAELFQQIPNADIFREFAAPDAFLHEEPSYVTWTPQVHRAP